MNRLFISAAHKSSGKTTISLGLCAALSARGMAVQAFKKGPDYIDPMWLAQATGRPCHNLDFFTMERAEILETVAAYGTAADIAVIEGNKGLYDGLDLDGSNSNAALARLLETPVILVIDARGMTRGIAPLVLGYQAFDPDIRIAGVILNRLGGRRHESKLRAVVEHYTDVPVVGAIHNDARLELVERHLGLMPSNEDSESARKISQIGDAIGSQVDMDAIVKIGASAAVLSALPSSSRAPESRKRDVRIGIARDASFGFYYPGVLEALERAGAELVAIDTLHDSGLPRIDGLFIGGGFPETSMEALEGNGQLRTEIRRAIETGLPVYAECGGLMYLTRSLTWKGKTCDMVGAIPADVLMHDRPQGRGYVRLEETSAAPWPGGGSDVRQEVAGHEFHYSSLENLDSGVQFAYRVRRGTGIDGKNDGIVLHNTLACYAHLRDTGRYHWAERFVAFVRECKARTPLHVGAGLR
ncbi:MAG: hydrogenobyrinic acid a,c-diamide synthase (glutamine-hydrolyzing) [Pseudomonadota bacterium]|nr:MAG: hydrogenobyrinic acid a,c-diamide synthase (glutamine-hydrolyzing) [Pseudomonadota bacterium]